MNNQQIKARQRARKLTLQSLYQIEISKHPVSEVEAQVSAFYDMSKVDTDYFRDSFRGICDAPERVDALFSQYLDRELTALGLIERSILRLGSFELSHYLEVPYKVVINESVRLARSYGATDSFNYINGVLDKVAKAVRSHEVKRDG